jgi:acyl transferase domain-containing protein/NAD(P)-dependent dehydrogenase (short-subunit alcohol dehydrogenase family)
MKADRKEGPMTATSKSIRPPIAVVGVSALFPGSVDSTGFWNDILAGTDRMTDVPPTHWLIDDHYDADPSVPDKTYGRRGGFLEPIDFDALGFGVPPSVVPSTDTAQLLALIVAQRVLDDALRGQFSELDRSRASVILGVTSGQELFGAMASRMNRPMWLQGMRRAGIAEDVAQDACDRILALHPEWTESTFPGLLGNVVAGRIANRLDLGGTNCVTDAACASSFSAMSMGINELYLGDSDLVIAGGVDTMNEIFMFMCFSKTPALSKSEDIRPFSDRADGTMLGEGIGMVALKRLDDAERDGNDIYCVVNGVGSSSDGRSKSVYAPVSSGQARALENAYSKTSYGPDTVELVEAHGTGTVAGDAAEVGGLELAFNATGRADRQWCALGSVKSQIGHTKAAAGAAGLFKVIMALHHKVLPQTAKIERPNPQLDVENSPFHLNTRTRPWVRNSDHERRGSVSSFGFGGSNFHIALSEYVGTATHAPRLRSAHAELVVLCGSDGADIVEQARDHIDTATSIGALSWLAQISQRSFKARATARLAVVASDEADLRAKLEQAAARIAADPGASFSTPTGIHYGTGVASGDVAFVFPGQGSQYLMMGSDLAMNYSEAMDAWDLAADQEWDEHSLHDVVFPITSFEDGADSANQSLLTATHWAQPAIGTMSLGLLRVLRAIGLEARHVAGHSFGEITALHAAGVLSEVDMIRVAGRRGTLMAEAAQTPGSMTAVTGSIDEVRGIVDRSGADVVIANHNSQRQVVLSGPTDAIDQIEIELNTAGVAAKRLPVATAFHSPVVSGASAAFSDFLDVVSFNPPVVPVYSNEMAEPYPSNDAIAARAQLARQLSHSVRFVDMIEAMYDRGARTFVEVGPSSVLTGLIGDILDGREHRAVPLDKKGRSGLTALFDGLGQLAAAGVEMRLDALWREYGEMSNPHETSKPKLAIPITGTNYQSPYPPQDLNELFEANPVSNTIQPTSQPTSQATPPPVASDVVYQAAPGVLVAYQLAQEQTAAAHTAYLTSMAQAHSAFLEATQHGIAVLGQLAGAGAGAAMPVMPSVAASVASMPPPVLPVAPVQPMAPVAAPVVTEVPIVAPPVAVPVAVELPAAASAGVSSVEMMPLLLGVVSDRTGYPVEMLSMEMELESDLGIDSIKRVEILSAMQDLVPELPDVDMAQLARLATLGEIVNSLSSQIAGPAAERDSTPAPVGSFGRFVVQIGPAPISESPSPGLLDGEIIVTDDGGGVAEALVAEFIRRGVDATVGSPGQDAGSAGLVYLGNLRDVVDVDRACTFNRDAFEAAQAFASSGGHLFVAVDDQHGDFASSGAHGPRTWAGGLTALNRTAALEWPDVHIKTIDIDRAGRSTELIARALADELLRGGEQPEVGLGVDGTRTIMSAVPDEVIRGMLPIGSSDVIVVSGGGRGVTAVTMVELARASSATFVLLGRSELDDEAEQFRSAPDSASLKQIVLDEATARGAKLTPADLDGVVGKIIANREIRNTLASIVSAGGRAQYFAVDITDLDAVEAVLAQIRADMGAITGVVHGAGVLADKLIVEKSRVQFDVVFDTKVIGLKNLLDATVDDRLKILCLFSSVAARTGNIGQADYAMANDVLNRVAISEGVRRGDGCIVKSIGWGPWAGGMVTPALKKHFELMGAQLIELDVGARMLVDELASSQTSQVEVVLGAGVLAEPGDTERMQRVGA